MNYGTETTEFRKDAVRIALTRVVLRVDDLKWNVDGTSGSQYRDTDGVARGFGPCGRE
jgi:hypothetical protein